MRAGRRWLLASAWGLLSACAPMEPPVVTAVADTVTLRESPPWLPEGWVEDVLPTAIPIEAGLTRTYSPQDATSPLLIVSRLTAEQAESLARQAAPESLLEWLAAKVEGAIQGPGNAVGERRSWRREGLARGERIGLIGRWPEGDAGLVSGEVGVGQTLSGAVILATALAPCRDDGSLPDDSAALVARLLASVPVEEGVAPEG